jgi:hypothetical protein
MDIRIVPIRPDFLRRVRVDDIDDLGQPIERLRASGGEPCRDVLRRARASEPLILASYCPFSRPGPYREYGPVFVLAEASDEPVALDRLPLPRGRAADYLGEQFVLRAYDEQERIADAFLSSPRRAEQDLQRLIADATVAFVLVRFAAYGCYALRVERCE